MNYYPHHIGDFNNATRHLSRMERSIYRDLIDLYYDTEFPISDDLDFVCRRIIATSQEERTAVEQVLNEFFTLDGGDYHNERCDQVIAEYQEKVAKRSKAGKASALARKRLKAKGKTGSTSVKQVSDKCSTDEVLTKNQEPRTNNQSKKGRFAPPSPQEVEIYIREKGGDITQASLFTSYYESNGWRVGKNPMKDWKAALRGWLSRAYSKPQGGYKTAHDQRVERSQEILDGFEKGEW